MGFEELTGVSLLASLVLLILKDRLSMGPRGEKDQIDRLAKRTYSIQSQVADLTVHVKDIQRIVERFERAYDDRRNGGSRL